MKESRGITLIVLIITIVVLLILAGITVLNLTGGGGVIEQAQTQKNKSNEVEKQELIEHAIISAQMKEKHELTTETLNAELKSIFKDNEELKEINNYWNYKGYKIDKDGIIEKLLLPEEYQQVEYIENTGTQYLATDYIANEDIEVVCKYQFVNSQAGDSMIFGFKNGNNRLSAEFYAQDRWYCACRNSGYRNVGGVGINSTNQYMANTLILNNKQFTATGTKYVQPNATYQVDNPIELYIFAWNVNNQPQYINTGIRIYYLTITNSAGQCVANFIPCYQKSDNSNTIKGMYDTVAGKFYTNQNTGDDFIVGPDI